MSSDARETTGAEDQKDDSADTSATQKSSVPLKLLFTLTYLSLSKIRQFCQFLKLQTYLCTCMKFLDPPLHYNGNSDYSKKMSLSWVSCRRRVNDFGNQKGCGICLVTAMNKIDCQLHFCLYCCFIGNCKSQCDKNFYNIPPSI